MFLLKKIDIALISRKTGIKEINGYNYPIKKLNYTLGGWKSDSRYLEVQFTLCKLNCFFSPNFSRLAKVELLFATINTRG